VVLPALKVAERDAGRGNLDSEETDKVASTVMEMLDNLSEFEPRRWFAKLRRKVNHDKEEEAAGGLASLQAAEEGEEGAIGVKLVERSELAPGWVVDEPVLCIGGRTPLDEAAAAMLAGVLKKRGLGAKALPSEEISAAHIASLAQTEAKLVALSLLDLGSGPAVIRYIVRRLRRILPKGTAILVCLWSEGEATAPLKAVLETAEADAYATTLPEAVETCIAFAKGEHAKKDDEATAEAAPPSVFKPGKAPPSASAPKSEVVPAAPVADAEPKSGKKQQATPRKPQTASA